VHCNYTASPGAADDEAVRCVSYPTAAAACRVRGKVLPTAAQWEHAARGRGEGWRYPWGNDPPTCCAAALAAGATLGCDPDRDVGTHATTDQCPIADRSLDGVLDLAGGVREWVSDAPIGWGACLSTVVLDPLCGGSAMGSTKGGSLDTPLEGGSSALWRSGAGDGFDVGFRCALADN
jgi:formylglycine-generating enzyme required for sulfatase activity